MRRMFCIYAQNEFDLSRQDAQAILDVLSSGLTQRNWIQASVEANKSVRMVTHLYLEN